MIVSEHHNYTSGSKAVSVYFSFYILHKPYKQSRNEVRRRTGFSKDPTYGNYYIYSYYFCLSIVNVKMHIDNSCKKLCILNFKKNMLHILYFIAVFVRFV